MSRKLITAQGPFKMLVPVYRGGSDPSRGVSGNPVVKRSTIEVQTILEIGGRGPEVLTSKGIGPQLGRLDFTVDGVSIHGTGTIEVSSYDFAGPTTVYLGEYTLTSDVEFDVESVTYAAEDITNTVPDGIIVIWKTAGAGVGEGTINVPANLPLDAGTVTISWTSGAVAKSQTDDGAGGFAGDGNPAGSSIDYDTGAIVLDTTGDIPDNATTITISYSGILTSLETAINQLPGYSASVASGILTVFGPVGPLGNVVLFEARGASPGNFTFDPSGSLSSAEPSIGPPVIT